MAIQTQIWAMDIAEKLFPEDSFMAQSISDDAWVNNKTVHLPQAGALPTVERNRSSLPATPGQRTDTTGEYDLDEFTSTPTLITDIEEVETSYNKRNSVTNSHSREINKQIANWMAYHWAPTAAAAMIRTSGSDVVSNVEGATGNRKALAIEDIFKAKQLLDDMDVDQNGRNILLPAHMYNKLIETNWKDLLSMDISGQARVQSGSLQAIFGFNIFLRGKKNILTYSNAATPVKREPGSNALTTANAGALVWHPDFVRRAKGGVKVYADYDKPEYYGSTLSAMARAGGRQAYTDGTGVVAIIEAAGS
jgi:hypothetical protein